MTRQDRSAEGRMTRTETKVVTNFAELIEVCRKLPPPTLEVETFSQVCQTWATDPAVGSIAVVNYDPRLRVLDALPSYVHLPAAADGYLFDRPINVIYASTEYQIETRRPTTWPANVLLPTSSISTVMAEIPPSSPVRLVYLRQGLSFWVSSPVVEV